MVYGFVHCTYIMLVPTSSSTHKTHWDYPRPMPINGISHGYFDLDTHFTTPTDSLPIDLRLLPCTITNFQSDNGSGYMVMGCTIDHEIPYALELDFSIQSPIHSIHADHGVHTIFSRMMAATHFLLRPPLPLLSLSLGYLPRTKGSGLPTPPFFFFKHHLW